ncbi:hypothetical protein N7519_005018 [Penicillium mononematosum]|uniref:uncharacterized protein n=1 Tax=Penicillium mononematosum TaxID=268346 RepID=UPI0025476F4C|nr:uncharacterized protein N7519_005018 [Penicillium mononematosum]KAJ6183717.1 hypothetical protein N7519_005018 [Penicillium mononematosum]
MSESEDSLKSGEGIVATVMKKSRDGWRLNDLGNQITLNWCRVYPRKCSVSGGDGVILDPGLSTFIEHQLGEMQTTGVAKRLVTIWTRKPF